MSETLVITEEPEEEQYPREVEFRSLTDCRIDTEEEVKIGEKDISEWNQVYIDVNLKAFSFLRVLAESLQMEEVETNLNPTSLLTAKKPYLYQMLMEKDLEVPTTISVSSPKGVNKIFDHFEGEVLGKKYSNLELQDREVLEEGELESFSESTDHFEDFIIFQENLDEEFEVLYLFGETIALKKVEGDRKYQVLEDEDRELVEQISECLGIELFQAKIGEGKVINVKPDIELEKFSEESGKNVYGKLVSGLGDAS